MAKQNIYANLPAVTNVIGLEDHGEDGTRCPHCGAEGRYVFIFDCADGTRRGAMVKCFGRFPSTAAAKSQASVFKVSQEAKAKGGTLPHWIGLQDYAARCLAAGVISTEIYFGYLRDADRIRRKGAHREYDNDPLYGPLWVKEQREKAS